MRTIILLCILTVILSTANSQVFTNYTTENGLANNLVHSIIIDSQGNKWIGTGLGVSKFNGTNWETFNSNSLSHNVSSIVIDKQNNLWFGTQGGGVTKYNGVNWTVYDNSTSYGLGNINSISMDTQGNLWFGTLFSDCIIFDGTTWTKLSIASNSNHNIMSISFDLVGNKWLGSYQDGVYKFNPSNTSTQYVKASNRLAGNNVYSICIDQQGKVWFGTESGVTMLNGTTWTSYTTTNGLINNSVHSIAIDSNGNKWFGTGGGISKFDGSNWTNYTTSNGLIHNNVNSIAIDAQNNKWFGTSGGVSKLFDDTSTALKNNQQLSKQLICLSNSENLLKIKTNRPNGTVYILDLNGKSLISKTLTTNECDLEVSNLVKGLYFVKYINGDLTETAKFIKN